MKIIQVHNYYPVIGGGEDTVVHEERRLLEEAGHTVVPFSRQIKERNLFDFMYAVLCLVWNPIIYFQMRKFIRNEKPDLVHCHNTFPLISPAIYWACAKEKTPVVQTLHNYRLLCPSAYLFFNGEVYESSIGHQFPWKSVCDGVYRNSHFGTLMLAILLFIHHRIGTWERKVSGYIALTEFQRKKMIQGGFPSHKIWVKPNFISKPSQNEQSSDQTALQQDMPSKTVIFIGRLIPEKGCNILLDAWNIFCANRDDINYELLIVGDGPERTLLEEKAISSVRFCGQLPRDTVLKMLQQATLLVVPSVWYEAFGLTMIEAFMLKTPVVASNIGNMSTVITDGETGVHFDAGNAFDLSNKIEWALDNPSEMKLISKNAQKLYLREFTESSNLERLVKIYNWAV